MTKLERFQKCFETATKRLHKGVAARDKAAEAYEALQEKAREAGVWDELCEQNGWAPDHTAGDASC